jgi:hypothetical protein
MGRSPPGKRTKVISRGNERRAFGWVTLIRHSTSIPNRWSTSASFAITSLARTLVDVARTEAFEAAVAMTDFPARTVRQDHWRPRKR